MTVELPPPAADAAPVSIAAGSPADVDERLAAWLAKSAAHERATRRMAIALPILIIFAGIVAYVLLRR